MVSLIVDSLFFLCIIYLKNTKYTFIRTIEGRCLMTSGSIIMTKTTDHKKLKLKRLKDPDYARGYLDEALSEYFVDRNNRAFLSALKDVADAQQNMTMLAKTTHKSRQSLYKSLSVSGNPTLNTLVEVMSNLGYKLSIETYEKKDVRNIDETKSISL